MREMSRRGVVVKRKIVSSMLFVFAGMVACADTTYPELLAALKNYQANYADTNAFEVIYGVACSEDHPDIVARCMGIYTLHMGAMGNAAVCQGGFLSIRNRQPNSSVIEYLHNLDLFPEPCPTCNGTGSVPYEKTAHCSTCNNSGKCPKCEGYGEYWYCGYCRKTWTKPQLKRLSPWLDHYRWCPQCDPSSASRQRAYGKKEPTRLQQKKCTDCSSTGKCPQCRGRQGTTSGFRKCPTCAGVPAKGVRTAAARQGLVELCRDTTALLQQTVDCEKSFQDALELDDAKKRVSALKGCLDAYPVALNREQVSAMLAEQMHKLEALTQEKEQRERKLALAKEQEAQRQKESLQAIRDTQSKRAALAAIQQFLIDHPDASNSVEARLLLAELKEAVAAEDAALAAHQKKAKRTRWLLLGAGILISAGILLKFIVNAIAATRKVEVMIPVTSKRQPVRPPTPLPRQEPPPQHVSPAYASAPRVLAAVTINTPAEQVVACAECGVLVDCPPDVQHEDVICGVCQKAFHVS
jgi:hypothetical protein